MEIFANFKEYGSNNGLSCGGAILNSTEIVTAAHCTFDLENERPLGAGAFVIVAGTTSVTKEEIENNKALQARSVSAVRVHPLFEVAAAPGAADDVAVLKLETPLTIDNTTVKQIGLASAGEAPSEGAAINLTGFGQQHPGAEEDGSLYALGMTVGSSERCGGEADAVFVCASAPTGSGCHGDSGSGATAGAAPVLVGILDTVEVLAGESCRGGATNGLANVAAPEIREFLEGSETPHEAPRGGSGIVVRAVPKVGHVVTCEPGPWSGSPTFTYSFVNSANGQVLQSGSSSTYTLTTADVGRTIYCRLMASNAGGTGVVRTSSLRPVEALLAPAPRSPAPTPQSGPLAQSTVAITGLSLTTQGNGTVNVKLDCKGSQTCTGTLTLQALRSASKKHAKKASRRVTIGRASFLIAAGKTANLTIQLNRPGRALLSAGHGRLTVRLVITQARAAGTEVRIAHLVEQLSHSHRKRKHTK